MPATDNTCWGVEQDRALQQYFDDLIESGEKRVPMDTHSICDAWQDLDPTRTRSSFFHNYKRKAEMFNDQLKEREKKDSKFVLN